MLVLGKESTVFSLACESGFNEMLKRYKWVSIAVTLAGEISLLSKEK